MRKSKLFIFISILTIIFLFGTAALIDRCSILSGSSVDEEEKKEAEEDTIDKEMEPEEEIVEETLKEETIEEENIEEETEEKEEPEDEEPQQESQSPTIDLLIYEGPTYSEDDDVCYFRVEASVTGNPTPAVVFSKDDSGGAWGPLKAQVNLNYPAETYTLSATAVNSEGTATDSLELSWGCSPATKGGNTNPVIVEIDITGDTFTINPGSRYGLYVNAFDPDGDDLTYKWTVTGGSVDDVNANPTAWNSPDSLGTYNIKVEIEDGRGGWAMRGININVGSQILMGLANSMDIPIVSGEGGFISSDGQYFINQIHKVGDDVLDLPIRGFISFDISELSGKTIESATLELNTGNMIGTLTEFTPIWIIAVDWGDGPINENVFDTAGYMIQGFLSRNIICTSNRLEDAINEAINNGRERFQIRLQFFGTDTNYNSGEDQWWYYDHLINLNVNYSP